MFCTNCGAYINKQSLFCPSCGKRGDADNIQGKEKSVIEKKPMPLWYKIAAGFAFAALLAVTGGILFTENFQKTIQQQLKHIKNHDIAQAYFVNTAREFQEATSYETFEEFVTAYPAIFDNKAIDFYKISQEDHIRTLIGTLTANDDSTLPIEYKLIKEDGSWKILSIRLLKANKYLNDESIHSFSDKAILSDLINQQLNHLRIKNIEHAYKHTSSKEFKKSTSVADFEGFVASYPVFLQENKAQLGDPVFEEEFAFVPVTLSNGRDTLSIDYQLVFEKNHWKIYAMEIKEEMDSQIAQDDRSHLLR